MKNKGITLGAVMFVLGISLFALVFAVLIYANITGMEMG